MTISAGSDILASDFISTSAGAGDSGKAPKLGSTGKLDATFLDYKFGGDGSDGALTVSSGTTNIDLGAAAVVVKQYTSISITSTGAVTFSNPHAGGTIIILKVQGNVTLTSSTIPNLDASGMGAVGGTGGAASSGAGSQTNNGGTDSTIVTNYQSDTSSSLGKGASANTLNGATANSAYPNQYIYTLSDIRLTNRTIIVTPGNGGGGGGGGQSQLGTATAGGAGGRGGGALIIQCGGALNFTSALGVDVSGKNGTAASSATTSNGYQCGAGAGGAGGSAGMCLILYNTLTSASGTVNAKGGNGGAGGGVTTTGTGGGSASGAGGGGCGGASFTNAGGAGGNGGAVNGSNNNGNAGSNGTAGSGGGGGGGSCNSSGTAATTTGGAGGTGGTTNTSLWLITKNQYHT